MLNRFINFFQKSIRNKLVVLLPLVTSYFLIFPFVLSIYAIRQQIRDNIAHFQASNIFLFGHQLEIRIALILIAISVVAVVAQIVVIILISHAVSKPIIDLAKKTENMAEGKEPIGHVPFSEKHDEVGMLAKSVNHFLLKIKHHETELAEQRVHAELGKVAAGVAHDMRNSLALLEVAKEQLELLAGGSEGFRVLRDLIHRGSTDLREVAEDLLRKYRGEEKQLKTFFLTEQLDDALNLFRGPGRYAETTFTVNHGVNGTQLQGDPTLLRRSIVNIVKNAVEAMRGKGTITLSTVIEENAAIVTIADTGPGMDEETIKKVLQGGYTNGKANGNGIGTTVVRDTVKEFGGTVEIVSEVGKGTEFRLRLPICHPEPITCHPEPVAKDPSLLKVLVIDDDEGIRLAWKVRKKALGIGELKTFPSMESCEAVKPEYATFDYAFVDKNIDDSAWGIDQTLRYLKTNGVKKVVLATGESLAEVHADPACAHADSVSREKIPASFAGM